MLPDLAAVSEGQDAGSVPYLFTTERLADGTSWYPLASSRVDVLESQSERPIHSEGFCNPSNRYLSVLESKMPTKTDVFGPIWTAEHEVGEVAGELSTRCTHATYPASIDG